MNTLSKFAQRLQATGQKLAQNWSKTTKLAGVAAVLAAGVVTASATAGGPIFNNLPQDYPTLQVQKAGDSGWNTSIQSTNGEYLNLLIWAHNTQVGTTAQNTKVKISLPTTFSTSHTPEATVWAANAAAVNGQVQITTSSQSKLSYVNNSAKLMKNVNGSMQFVSWPTGIDPNAVVTAGGVDLGNIDGCWTYAQAVMLQVRVEGGQAAISTNKKVALPLSTFADSVDARPGDAVEYRVFIENTGTATGIAPQIVDFINAKTDYIPGTSSIRAKVDNQDVDQPIPEANVKKEPQGDGTTKLTWQFTDMGPTPDTALYLHFQVRIKPADSFVIGKTVIPNQANSSFAGGVAADTNTVTVNVQRDADPVVTFNLFKEVANLTLGDTDWKNGEPPAVASPGDLMAYRMIITNTGNVTATNVTLKDLLPAGLTYQAGTSRIYNSQTGDAGRAISDSWITSGYTFDTFAAGTPNQQIIYFRAKLTDNCTGRTTVTNTAQVWYQSKKMAEDTASAVFTCTRGLVLIKEVLDPKDGVYKQDIGTVAEETVLTYRINVLNNGNITLINPQIKDVLPAYVTYINNSLSIDGEFMSSAVQSNFFNGGIILTNLTPGLGKQIIFQVKTAACPPLGDTVIVNTAYAWAQDLAQISSQAKAVIRVTRPTL